MKGWRSKTQHPYESWLGAWCAWCAWCAWSCMIVYDLVQSYYDTLIIDLYVWKSAQFRTNYSISFMFWLQISSIVLIFGMIAGMPGFWSQPWLKSQLVTSPATSRKTGPRCCMTCHHDALNHFKRLNGGPIHGLLIQPKPHRWDLLLPTECYSRCERLNMAHRCTDLFQKVASVACRGAFDGIWIFFLQGG